MKAKKSSSLKRHRELVAVETDGFSVLCTVMRVDGSRTKAVAVAETHDREFSVALSQGLSRLRAQIGKLPRKAVLVTSDAFPAVLELPVDPRQPRSHDEMAELVRWEIEPYLSQVLGAYPLGTILASKGWMSPEQVSRVLAAARESSEPSLTNVGGTAQQRFGELAVSLGFVERRQIDEALDIQGRIRTTSDQLVCGWTPLDSESGTAPWKWLVCAMDSTRREAYRAAFEAAGLDLDRVYPLFGTSVSSLNGSLAHRASVIDVYKGALGHVELSNSRIESLAVHYHSHPALDADTCLQLAELAGKEEVWISGRSRSLREFEGELSERVPGQVRCVRSRIEQRGAAKAASGFLGAISGAVADAVEMAPRGRSVFVRMRDPAPPVSRRPALWWIAAVCLFVLALGPLEYYFYSQRTNQTSELSSQQRQLQQNKDTIRAIEDQNTVIGDLNKKLSESIGALFKVGRERIALRSGLHRRSEFPTAVLNAVARSVNQDVSVDRIAERLDGSLEIDAWSLSEESLQRFAREVLAGLEEWKLAETNSSVFPRIGRYDLPGFTLELTLDSQDR